MANGTLAVSQLEILTQSGTGIITVVPPATNTNRTLTLPDATGTMVASGTTPSLNGIAFPATQVPSANANTLDDYEEGTWTCVVSGQSATATGEYTKVGKIVYVSCYFVCNSNPTGGALNISGLPFPSSVNAKGAAPLRLDVGNLGVGGSDVAGFATGTAVYIAIEGNSTLHYVRGTSTQVNPYYSDGLFKSTTTFSFSFTYQAAV